MLNLRMFVFVLYWSNATPCSGVLYSVHPWRSIQTLLVHILMRSRYSWAELGKKTSDSVACVRVFLHWIFGLESTDGDATMAWAGATIIKECQLVVSLNVCRNIVFLLAKEEMNNFWNILDNIIWDKMVYYFIRQFSFFIFFFNILTFLTFLFQKFN